MKTMDLADFVHHYENKIEEMRLAELGEDFRCKNGMPHLKVKSGIFKHSASEYTMKIFSFFEQELISCFGVRMTEFSNNGIDYIYEAFEEEKKSAQSLRLSELLHQGNFAFSVGSLSDLGTKIIKQKLMEALKILENDEEIANAMGNLNKRDNNISSNECLVLNPSIIKAKDVTNARIKNSLEKRKKKSAKVGGSSQSSRPNSMSFGNFILLLALMI
ncbi:hypothetical protein FEM48_Zijuj10G0150400 [Ziziphus jujuba var. spinosa]|uniref:Uncharacterized protein n=1 Tax=Ziziphus jujuba var. spinosa TaxID=714518 RepID=A0A978UP30_ZIZJJ|nr:hypothetical protein FEM48_Zijuj10G0150400 [Ziziphus jujuba var. spinosa]